MPRAWDRVARMSVMAKYYAAEAVEINDVVVAPPRLRGGLFENASIPRNFLCDPSGALVGALWAALERVAAYRPVARVCLAAPSDRRACPSIRAAYAVYKWAVCLGASAPLLPSCRTCGEPTGCFCDSCLRALCTRCDREAGGVCAACVACRPG